MLEPATVVTGVTGVVGLAWAMDEVGAADAMLE